MMDNAGWGLLVENPSEGVSIHYSSFVNNGSGGLGNNQPNDADVEATLNYWGAPVGTGPAGGRSRTVDD